MELPGKVCDLCQICNWARTMTLCNKENLWTLELQDQERPLGSRAQRAKNFIVPHVSSDGKLLG